MVNLHQRYSIIMFQTEKNGGVNELILSNAKSVR